jgi:hypothetical protein
LRLTTTHLVSCPQAKSKDGGAIFALISPSKLRGCVFNGNKARKGANFYNHGGDASFFCRKVAQTYNKPKVRNGHYHLANLRDNGR